MTTVISFKFVTEKFSRKIQIIMTLFIPENAKVNTKRHGELCYPE